MNRGLYTAAIGMMTQMSRMDVITNNIANVDTTGFKEDDTVVQSFSEKFMKILNDPSQSLIKYDNRIGKVTFGNFISNISTNFEAGSVKQTGNHLDIAINGEGFFTVNAKDEKGKEIEKYTRDGSFVTNADGELVTKDGYFVLGEKGNIKVPKGVVSVNEKGEIYVNDELIDKLKVVNFKNKETLRKTGENLYKTTKESTFNDFKGSLLQGYVEESNVNSVNQMVKMIQVSRAYEMNEKVIKTQDELLGKAVNEIAKK